MGVLHSLMARVRGDNGAVVVRHTPLSQGTTSAACRSPGCSLPALLCARHGDLGHHDHEVDATLIDDVIRELQWDDAVRWEGVVERLRRARWRPPPTSGT